MTSVRRQPSADTKRTQLTYLMAGLAVVCLLVDVGLALAKARALPMVLVFVGAIAFLCLGAVLAFTALQKQTGMDTSQLFVGTWLPFATGTAPVAGPFLVLWGAIRLFKGRIGAVTVINHPGASFYVPSLASHSIERHYAVDLKSLGKPAGTILLLWACIQPMAAVLVLLSL
jgi:hypothetical protein